MIADPPTDLKSDTRARSNAERVGQFQYHWKYRSAAFDGIDLKPEVEASLAAQARERGVSVVEYVGSLLEKFAPPRAQRSPEQHISALHEWLKEFPQTAPPLSDEAVSRESLYDDKL